MTEERGAYGVVENPSPAPPALVVVDVQQGFADWPGERNNPGAEDNIGRLLAAWRDAGWPVVRVRHDSVSEGSPLRPGLPGNALHPVVEGPVDLEFAKSVHSCFHGEIDLDWWLRESAIGTIVVCGVQTNMCCETTARVGSDLGYDVWFVLDATWTYSQPGLDGGTISADQIAAVTASTLAADFCEVLSTDEAVARVADGPRGEVVAND